MTFRHALITGASSGIGAAFARALPKSTGLLLTGRDREKLAQLAAELALNDRPVRTIVADLSNADGRRALIHAVEDVPIDLLINNAGLGWLGPVTDNPPEREAEMVQVNCAAPVELTRALLPGMIRRARERQERAGLIFVASAAAFMPIPLFATYAASKAFLLHYAEALAEELDHAPVDVLALCPGATKTRFFERANVAPSGVPATHDPDRVAREGLQALGRRLVHVVGPGTYLATAAARFLPRRLVTAAAERAMRR
ncbi:MAG TPA: SDR family NAD(P)-dependent oxidoreductase, partial [Dongiaceae bacterium]|nr:SDR family NAD(P)-dependent oxidoreductase [Dongiaceae bacterium]